MDPFSEQGLAAPSLYHGCSTDSKSDWTVVGKKNKPVTTEGKNSTEEIIAPCDEEDKKMESKGSPPFKDEKNPFGHLHDDEDDELPDETTEEIETKQMLPPRKKMKVEIRDEDWHQVCEEFQKMPAPEYSNSSQPRQVFHINTTAPDTEDHSHNHGMTSDSNKPMKFSYNSYEDHKAYEMLYHCFDDSIELKYDDNGAPDITLSRHKIMNEFEKVEHDPKYQQFIHEARTLPKIYGMPYPAMLSEIYPNNYNFREESQFGSEGIDDNIKWASHGQKKKNEQLREESTFLMYEITRLGMFPQYKSHYDFIEDTLDAWRIPHKQRSQFRRHEMNYLSLMIHDTLPEYYMDYLLPKDEEPKGRIYNFFHKHNDSLTARYKWYAAIKNNYNKFYKTILGPLDVTEDDLDYDLLVMIKDIVYIMIFINPQAMLMLMKNNTYRTKLNKIIDIAHENHHHTTSRHDFFYEWLYFGWTMLPNAYPLHKNKGNNNIDTTTMWVHKALTHEEYISNDLITIYDDAGNMARITVQNYVQNGEKWRELDAVAVPDTREFNGTNYLNIGSKNGAELAQDHWIYEQNYELNIAYRYDEIKHDEPHNDDDTMTYNDELFQGIHYEQMAKLRRRLSNYNDMYYYDKVLSYFKDEILTDHNEGWSRLDALYYEDYQHYDTFYVPVRRRISIYWLKWRVELRGPNATCWNECDPTPLTKYIIYFPGQKKIIQRAVAAPMNCTWHDVEKYQMKKFPNKTISKRYIWSRVQHLKKYFKNSVESYDDLLLKYDALDEPVLHPLYTINMAHDDTYEYIPYDPCIGDVPMPHAPVYTMYLHWLANPKKIGIHIDRSGLHTPRNFDICPEETLPLEYRTAPSKSIVPPYLFGSKFENTCLNDISEQLNQHVHDLLRDYNEEKSKGARVSLRKLPTTLYRNNYSASKSFGNMKITGLSRNDPSNNPVICTKVEDNHPSFSETPNPAQNNMLSEIYLLEAKSHGIITAIIEGTRASNETRTKYSVSFLIPIPVSCTSLFTNTYLHTLCTDVPELIRQPTYQEFQVQPTREYALASTVLDIGPEQTESSNEKPSTEVSTHVQPTDVISTDEPLPTEITNLNIPEIIPTPSSGINLPTTEVAVHSTKPYDEKRIRAQQITDNSGSDSKINKFNESTNLSSNSDPILFSRIDNFLTRIL